MKKLLLILTATILLAGCSGEDKAQKMIKDYLSENMNDFKSYEPIEFSVDTLFVHRLNGVLDGEEVLKDSITYQRSMSTRTGLRTH